MLFSCSLQKKSLSTFVAIAAISVWSAVWSTASAQTYNPDGAAQMIREHQQLCANNYTAYDNLYDATDHTMTPAPDGYQAFYISAYMRHGSRWLIQVKDYTNPILFLEDAKQQGRLTPKGKRLLKDLHQLLQLAPSDKLGVLTDVGFEQHNGIAFRMCERFPEVFDKKAYVHARSSRVARCIKSMAEEAEVIARKGRCNVIQESGKDEWQDYLAHGSLQPEIKEAQKPMKALIGQINDQYIHPERFIKSLMKEQKKTAEGQKTKAEEQEFMRKVFELATNMQSHKFGIDLYQYFTEDELYDLYRNKNIYWYLRDGAAPQTGSISPWRQRWLLQDFLDAADTLVGNRQFHGATLRFGHESCLMPLVALMELGTLGAEVQNLDTLDHVWRGSEIFPMAGNVQLIFYRPRKGPGEILVKALLNEREIALPGTPVIGPYYRWEEIRAAWRGKLARYSF